jgi:hypothetical protein
MNRSVTAEMPRLCLEKLLNKGLLPAFFTLIRILSSRHALDPEVFRGSLGQLKNPTVYTVGFFTSL